METFYTRIVVFGKIVQTNQKEAQGIN